MPETEFRRRLSSTNHTHLQYSFVSDKFLPVANTCGLVLRLPVQVHYDELAQVMDMAAQCCISIGFAVNPSHLLTSSGGHLQQQHVVTECCVLDSPVLDQGPTTLQRPPVLDQPPLHQTSSQLVAEGQLLTSSGVICSSSTL